MLKREKNFVKKKVFLLVAFDISGVNDFIYTITSEGAYKQLRSRAFYVSIINEWLSDTLLDRCNLTRANLLFSSMGKTYFLLANTCENKEVISNLEKAFNEFLAKTYSLKLQVHFGMSEVSANDLQNNNMQDKYSGMFENIEQQIKNKKLSKGSGKILRMLNSEVPLDGRECSVCHSISNLERDTSKCYFCMKLEKFSNAIQQEENFVVNGQDGGLPLGFDKYLHALSNDGILTSNDITYTKNKFNIGSQPKTYLWIPDYSDLEKNEFNLYVERNWTDRGIKRLGALICGIDDLKWAMLAGFSEQNGGMFMSLSRSSTLMRRLNMFLQVYLNSFAKEMKLKGTFIHSNGGEIFILGAWDSLLDFAMEINKKFAEWTGKKMSVSMGLGIFSKKTPINVISEKTKLLYQVAKNNDGDSICLFDQNICYNLEDFTENVYGEKFSEVKEFFDNTNEKGSSFIYTLIDLLRNSTNKLSFARLVYCLAKVEERITDKTAFKKFSDKIVEWFNDPMEAMNLELALMIYVYKNRRENSRGK